MMIDVYHLQFLGLALQESMSPLAIVLRVLPVRSEGYCQ